LNIPEDLKYTKSHEWVKIEGNIATVGITDHAQSELGDIVYVDLPSPGRMVGVDDAFGTVESVKTVSDIYSPVAGEVVEANADLEASSELMNQDPYGRGWLVKIRFESASEKLLTANEYKDLLGA
jgi:glycine cleavage system H protein